MPQSCSVMETLNGEWELILVHPIDEQGKWRRLAEGCILRAPVPAAMTPRVNISISGEDNRREIYEVDTDKPEASVRRGTLRLRTGPGTEYTTLKQYSNGTQMQLLAKTNASWYEVMLPDGKRGYMSTTFLRYVRTEGTVSSAIHSVTEPRQLRDQPFRIYRVAPELDKVTVYARHIFYDLLDNMIKRIEPSPSTPGAAVAQSISSSCLSAHSFTFYSDLTSTAEDVKIENANPVEAMLGESGLVERYGGELARDWFDVFLVNRVGSDSDVQIRERKNLTGISYDVDETDVVTRIMPTGEDADGNILYLPELYIDSPNIGAYTHPKWSHLAVSEAKEVAEGENYKSLTECYSDMRKAAQAEFEKGCDLPTVTLKVDFVNCPDTEEYKQYAALSDIFLGDSVRVVARRIGVEVSMRMTQYTYDCLTRKYTSVTLGTAADTLEGSTISARQLASGSISGMKLAFNSVGAGHLMNGAVGSLQIKNAAIGSAHIQDAAITRAHIAEALIDVLNVNALTAVTAKIEELAAGSITTDELYTSIAMIATAQLTTANIVNAQIQWADIEALAANIAWISKAQINTANISEANIDWAAITTLSAAVASMVNASIGTADIDWAHIKDLATDTAIITQGVGGELYIAKLAVTEANLVSLTVGELVVKGEDGRFYSVSVDEDGKVISTLKQIGNSDVQDLSINAGEKIIEGTITAGCLDVQDIFAANALIKSLIAANLDVDALFARQATINALNAMDITSNTYLKLMVADKADKSDVDALDQRLNAAELKITEDAIVSTVTGSEQYRQAQQQIYADVEERLAAVSSDEFVIGTQTVATAMWKGNASFAELKDGQQITYWLPYTSGINVTLSLTLKDGSTTEAIPCYYGGTARLSTQYPAGSILHLTYRENASIYTTTIAKGWWADANYNTDTYDRIRIGGTLKAKTVITANRLVVGDEAGCYHLASGIPFDVTRPILFAPFSIAAGSFSTSYFLSYPNCYLRSMLPAFTGVVNTTCYLVGVLKSSTFTPIDGDFLTSTTPTQEDGYTYIALGILTGTYQICLFPEHPMYRFADGEFKSIGQVAYEALKTAADTRTEMTTRFEQTSAALALKADSTTVSALGNRVSAAEQKITPEAITATVTSAARYAYEKYAGRNYCLNSGNVHTFIDNRYRYPNNITSGLTSWNLSVSDDLYSHSGNGAAIRISFEIKRTNVDASAALTADVYSGIWVYYRYYAADGVTLNTTGLGYYLRATSVTTDSDWVKMRYGPLNLTTYNPISFAYFSLGTGSANGTTGTVQFRNVKLEVLDTWTDWSAAPEDLYGLADRMESAESSITQNTNSIALRVYTSTYNMEKVYRGTAEPSTKYVNMCWLDMSLTPNILKRWTGSAWAAVGAQEIKTSGVSIGANNVAITTENFLLQLLDPANNENVLMEMSANGNVGFKELYADEVVSDSIVNAYTGPSTLYVYPSLNGASANTFRTLREAIAEVNGKYLRYNVVVTFLNSLTETIYEPQCVEIYGISGPYKLQINGYNKNKTVAAFMIVKSCTALIEFYYLTLRDSRPATNGNKNDHLITCSYNSYVSFKNCVMDCNNTTYRAIQSNGSYVDIRNTQAYNAYIAFTCDSGTMLVNNCKGVCDWSIFNVNSLVFCWGTIPVGGKSASNNGQIYANNTTTDSGSATVPVAPDETTIQYATLTMSWRGSWRTDTLDVIQGVYSDYGYSSSLNWNRGCMWFGNLRGTLSGGTVKSATLTLYRKTGGSFAAKNVYLCAITNMSASGTPSIAASYGAIGVIGRGSQITFSIPIAAVQGLANGTYGGLCLFEPSYHFGTANWSDCYMRMAGTDSSYKPYLTIVYSGGSAVG